MLPRELDGHAAVPVAAGGGGAQEKQLLHTVRPAVLKGVGGVVNPGGAYNP